MDINQHLEWFANFATAKIAQAKTDREPLELKRKHTLKVYANAVAIAKNENFAPDLAHICALAALYHDLARFDQYLEYGTFKDAQSCNHGIRAVKLVKQHKRLADEPISGRHAILAAIGLHNRKALPPTLGGNVKIAAQATRDADKLDILRVMDEHLAHKPYNPTVVLSLPDSDSLYGDKVIDAALSGRSALYADLRSVNDFRLLLGTWFFDMNFPSSKRIFIEQGHAHSLLKDLPDNEIYGKAKNFILEQMAQCGG